MDLLGERDRFIITELRQCQGRRQGQEEQGDKKEQKEHKEQKEKTEQEKKKEIEELEAADKQDERLTFHYPSSSRAVQEPQGSQVGTGGWRIILLDRRIENYIIG